MRKREIYKSIKLLIQTDQRCTAEASPHSDARLLLFRPYFFSLLVLDILIVPSWSCLSNRRTLPFETQDRRLPKSTFSIFFTVFVILFKKEKREKIYFHAREQYETMYGIS
jgi:hypothetical protein